jgi:hypothetical protein
MGMAGITLSADEIKAAPPEVRRWLEHEVIRTLGSPTTPAAAEVPALVGVNIEEARDVLALVQGILPVVSVLFELGREASSVAVHGLRAFRVGDIMRHTRLQSADQVVECLDILTDALRRVRGDAAAEFCALDEQGHCLVAEATMRSILRLWQEIVAARALAGQAGDAPARPAVG